MGMWRMELRDLIGSCWCGKSETWPVESTSLLANMSGVSWSMGACPDAEGRKHQGMQLMRASVVHQKGLS